MTDQRDCTSCDYYRKLDGQAWFVMECTNFYMRGKYNGTGCEDCKYHTRETTKSVHLRCGDCNGHLSRDEVDEDISNAKVTWFMSCEKCGKAWDVVFSSPSVEETKEYD